MTQDRLRHDLDRLLGQTDRPHVARLSIGAAIISTALRERGLEATLVGGGAIEFYDPGAHDAEDAYDMLRRLAASDSPITEDVLTHELDRIRAQPGKP